MSIKSDSPLYKYVVNYIHTKWGSKDYFPGPQPISIEYKHFPILKSAEYVVCEKTDGERHMMVALMFEGKKKCLFVNRAFNMFEVPINLKKAAYEGTILDGELYDNTLMVYDAVLVNGESVWDAHLMRRLEAARGLMKSIIYMKSDKWRLKCKTFYQMRDFEKFMDEYLPTVQQKIDGLVFTPVNEPIRIGTHETMFKWKPQEKNTVDFLMKKEPSRETPGFKPGLPAWRLYVQEKGSCSSNQRFRITESRMNPGLRMELSWSVSISHGKNLCGGNLSSGGGTRRTRTIDGHSIERSSI